MKKVISVILSLALGLVMGIPTFADTNPTITNDEAFLLAAAQEVIDAYNEFYVIKDIEVSDVYSNELDDGDVEVNYYITFHAVLGFESATELPQICGLSEMLGIESAGLSTSEFTALMNSFTIDETISSIVNEKLSSERLANFKETSSDFLHSSQATINYVTTEVTNFVNSIEEEYIGKESTFSVGLKITLDEDKNVIDTMYAVFGGFSDDISLVVPNSVSQMTALGKTQLDNIVTRAIEKSSTTEADASIDWNSSFVYYRTDASDYANTYTSNPSFTTCTNKSCTNYGGSIRQNTDKYNSEYTAYCCHDCANFVSQAMYAGNVPTSSDWSAGTSAWINCASMKTYFTNRTWWSTSSFSDCNAGGIIMLFNSYKTPYHVQMNVMNDTITRAFSSHTNDYKNCAYSSTSVFGADSVTYYVFDNVSPAH